MIHFNYADHFIDGTPQVMSGAPPLPPHRTNPTWIGAKLPYIHLFIACGGVHRIFLRSRHGYSPIEGIPDWEATPPAAISSPAAAWIERSDQWNLGSQFLRGFIKLNFSSRASYLFILDRPLTGWSFWGYQTHPHNHSNFNHIPHNWLYFCLGCCSYPPPHLCYYFPSFQFCFDLCCSALIDFYSVLRIFCSCRLGAWQVRPVPVFLWEQHP